MTGTEFRKKYNFDDELSTPEACSKLIGQVAISNLPKQKKMWIVGELEKHRKALSDIEAGISKGVQIDNVTD